MSFCTYSRFNVSASLLVLLIILSACAPATSDFKPVQVEDAENMGRLSFFLNLYEVDGPDLFMQISAIQLQSEDGTLVTHSLDSLVVESGRVLDGQKFLARMAIAPGKYTQVRLLIAEAGHVREQGSQLIPLKSSETVMNLRTPLDISVGDSRSQFFTWDTKQSLQDRQFYPAVKVAPSLKKLVADVAYVACPEIDTVYMVSIEQNRVIDSLGIPGGPTYLFQNGDPSSDEVFVLAGDDLKLYLFSPTTNRLTERYNLNVLNDPSHAAFSPNGRWGYIVDPQLGTVSRMDMNTGTIDKQLHLNFEPSYIVYLDKYDLLAVSLSINQTVVLINAETMEQAGSISTGNSPGGLRLVDERFLYIAEKGANSAMLFDLDTNSMIKRIPVGFQPRRIQHTNNFVYVANYGDNTITTLRYGLLTAARDIPFPGKPLEMAYADKFNWLYVGNQKTMSLEVINSLTNTVDGRVELGAVPHGILVVQDNNSL